MNLNNTNARIGTIHGGTAVDFSRAKLVGVDFTGSDLSTATFSSETMFSDGATGVNLINTNGLIGTIHGGTAV